MQRILLALCLLLSFAGPASADEVAEIPAAREALLSWLSLTDAHKYGPAWDNASAPMKRTVTRQQWEDALNQARAPLGVMKSRSLKTLTYTKVLPGIPDGNYLVIQFNTNFQNKDAATETATVMKEGDQVWRVTGYYIGEP